MTGFADRLDVRGIEVVDLSQWKDEVFNYGDKENKRDTHLWKKNPAVPFCPDKVGLPLRPFRALARGAVKKATNSQKSVVQKRGQSGPTLVVVGQAGHTLVEFKDYMVEL